MRPWRGAPLVLASTLLANGCAGPAQVGEGHRGAATKAAVELPTAVTGANTSAGAAAKPATSAPPLRPPPARGTSTTSVILNSQPTVTLAAPPARTPGVDMTNPVSVARAALTALWTVNAAADKSPYAAELRATAYMTSAYAAEIRATPPVAAAGAQWQAWVAHHVVTTVTLVAEHDWGAPPSTPTSGLPAVRGNRHAARRPWLDGYAEQADRVRGVDRGAALVALVGVMD